MKNYVSPFAEVVEFEIEAVLAPSDVGGPNDEIVTPGGGNNEEAGGKIELGF